MPSAQLSTTPALDQDQGRRRPGASSWAGEDFGDRRALAQRSWGEKLLGRGPGALRIEDGAGAQSSFAGDDQGLGRRGTGATAILCASEVDHQRSGAGRGAPPARWSISEVDLAILCFKGRSGAAAAARWSIDLGQRRGGAAICSCATNSNISLGVCVSVSLEVTILFRLGVAFLFRFSRGKHVIWAIFSSCRNSL